MGCGKSTNTREELMSLWELLYFSKEIGLPMMHIFGDSSIIISWEKGISTLTSLELEAWYENIKELTTLFTSIDYQHVYREYNEKENILSKEGLELASGLLSFTEYYEGIVIGEATIQFF